MWCQIKIVKEHSSAAFSLNPQFSLLESIMEGTLPSFLKNQRLSLHRLAYNSNYSFSPGYNAQIMQDNSTSLNNERNYINTEDANQYIQCLNILEAVYKANASPVSPDTPEFIHALVTEIQEGHYQITQICVPSREAIGSIDQDARNRDNRSTYDFYDLSPPCPISAALHPLYETHSRQSTVSESSEAARIFRLTSETTFSLSPNPLIDLTDDQKFSQLAANRAAETSQSETRRSIMRSFPPTSARRNSVFSRKLRELLLSSIQDSINENRPM